VNRLSALALVSVISLSACSSGGAPSSLPATPSATKVATAGAMKLDAYRLPLATDARVQSAARAGQAKLRVRQNSYGGVPTVDGSAAVTDAPNFGPGGQVNLAVVEVDAIGEDGATYPIAQYGSGVVVNVLDYQHSALNLGTSSIPAMKYKGVQLVIDPTQSSVLSAGQTYPMQFGSRSNGSFVASSDALATVFYASPIDASTGSPAAFLMDFNTNEWIALDGSQAQVAAVGTAASYDRSIVVVGSIANATHGIVSNATIAALDSSGAVVASTQSRSDGTFELHALNAGSYDIVIDNSYTPPSLGQPLVAVGNTTDGRVRGPRINVPSGYRLNVGQIQD